MPLDDNVDSYNMMVNMSGNNCDENLLQEERFLHMMPNNEPMETNNNTTSTSNSDPPPPTSPSPGKQAAS